MRFLVAEVSSVSTLVVQGRALVMVVSRWPASVAAEVSLVASSPRGCVLCAKKFALRGLVVGVSAKKFALRAHNGPKLLFSGVLGELFRGNVAGGPLLGEFFRGNAAGGGVQGEFFRGPAVARERRRQAHKPPYLQGYDRGGTPKDPASRCVRWPCRQRQKLSARASARKQRPRSRQARTLSSSTSP